MTGWLPFEKRWLLLLLQSVLPGTPGMGTIDLAPFWPMLHASAPPLLRFGLRASVWLLTWLPVLTPGAWRPFFLLGEEGRDLYLCRTLESRVFLLRELVQTLKIVSCFALFRDPQARAALGVQP